MKRELRSLKKQSKPYRVINIKLEDGVMKFSETFRISDGVPQHKFGHKFLNWCKSQEDGEYENTCQPLEIAKTHDQLEYIHVLIKLYSDEIGETKFACKLACKEIAGYYKVTKNLIRGGTSIEYKSFANASMKKLSEIIDKYYEYLVYDIGMNIPDAETYKQMTAEERSKLK